MTRSGSLDAATGAAISIDPDAAYAATIVAPSIGQHAAIAIALPPP